jgi:hypothetical protein
MVVTLKNKLVKTVTILLMTILLVYSLGFVCPVTFAAGSSWNIQTVDSDALSFWNSMVLDSNGNPHITYYSNNMSQAPDFKVDLKYASWTGSNWNIQTVASSEVFGAYSSLALDSSGNPHICYYDIVGWSQQAGGGTWVLIYASWTGSKWIIQTVDSDINADSTISLKLDSAGNPHIIFNGFHHGNSGLMYASWIGSQWNIQTVDPNGWINVAGVGGSLALDSAGNPHISYCQAANPRTGLFGMPENDFFLAYASWAGSKWNIQIVDSTENVSFNSLALDNAGHPHISYLASSNGGVLKYASFDGSKWNIQTVDSSSGCSGFYNSLALNSKGYPSISYLDTINSTLNYAYWTGSKWNTQVVSSTNHITDLGNSLALDSNGNPHIAYAIGIHGLNYAFDLSFSTSTSPLKTPDPSIFQVESNSTVTGLAFDSQKQELTFTVSGQSGTTGYVNVTVAKSFLASIDNLKVFLDGNQIDRQISSNENSRLITFYYTHSTHQVKIVLHVEESQFLTLAGAITAFSIIVAIGLIVYRYKHISTGKKGN